MQSIARQKPAAVIGLKCLKVKLDVWRGVAVVRWQTAGQPLNDIAS